MAQSGFTPIQLYYSTTALAAPIAGNLTSGELAINITDGKLYYKDNLGVVQTIADKGYATRVTTISFGSTGLTPATATSGAVTVGGVLAIGNGGTGQSTQQAALNALAGTQTANRLLRSDGTNVTFAQVALATDVSGLLPVANGGTGNNTGSAASVANTVTFNNGGSGDASGTTFNGSAARTISYNTVGAPSATGGGASGTWPININGTVGVTTPYVGNFTRIRTGSTSIISSGGFTPAADLFNQYNVIVSGGDIFFLAPSGTPADSQKLLIRITGDSVSRNITSWDAIYRAIGVILPATVPANKTIYVGCVYNSWASSWDVVAVTTQA